MSNIKPKAKTRAELLRENIELKAQLAHVYYFADKELEKASQSLHGSGVLLTMHALGGRELILPIVIKDGLSDETIEALRKDIRRSYDLAVMFKPKGLVQ